MSCMQSARILFLVLIFGFSPRIWSERNLVDIPNEDELSEDVRELLKTIKRPETISPGYWEDALGRYKIKMSRNAPVTFFGVVYDQNNRPLEGVSVSGLVRAYDSEYITQNGSATTDQKDHQWLAITDANGRFTVSGMSGLSLHIRNLEKQGYSAPNPEGYYRISGKQFRENVHEPNEDNPVVFYMWESNMVESDAELIQRAIKINGAADGTEYRVNLETGDVFGGNEIPYDISVMVLSSAQVTNSNSKYDWSFTVSACNGGILPAEESNPYEAPQDGYISPVVVQNKAKCEGWSRRVQQTFYVRTRDGDLHARVECTVYAYDDGKALIRLNSAAKKGGSRSLIRFR